MSRIENISTNSVDTDANTSDETIFVPDGVLSKEQEDTAQRLGMQKFLEEIDSHTQAVINTSLSDYARWSKEELPNNADLEGQRHAMRRAMFFLRDIAGGSHNRERGFLLGKQLDKISANIEYFRRIALDESSKTEG